MAQIFQQTGINFIIKPKQNHHWQTLSLGFYLFLLKLSKYWILLLFSYNNWNIQKSLEESGNMYVKYNLSRNLVSQSYKLIKRLKFYWNPSCPSHKKRFVTTFAGRECYEVSLWVLRFIFLSKSEKNFWELQILDVCLPTPGHQSLSDLCTSQTD